jgi:uncharacterized membrane protein YwaF
LSALSRRSQSGPTLGPDLAGGPTTVQFWIFWVPHCGIIAAATYDFLGRRFRPGWKDFLLAIGTMLVYLAVIIPFDYAINENYGYVGVKNGGPLDFLGPWPLRLFKASVGVAATLALVTVPWWIEQKVGRRRESDRSAAAQGFDVVPIQK